MSWLYILEINYLSVALFAIIFSYSEGCLFTLLIVSFIVQKLLIQSHLFIFVFISVTLGDRSKKILLQFMSKSVLPIFSSKSFIVSNLTFRSWIHFEFIFVVAHMVKNLLAVQETWVWAMGQEDPLEMGMATHSSILAWRIPWVEEPGKIQSMGSQRVQYDWATNPFTFTKNYWTIYSPFCFTGLF